jgi:hypothetical protein
MLLNIDLNHQDSQLTSFYGSKQGGPANLDEIAELNEQIERGGGETVSPDQVYP